MTRSASLLLTHGKYLLGSEMVQPGGGVAAPRSDRQVPVN